MASHQEYCDRIITDYENGLDVEVIYDVEVEWDPVIGWVISNYPNAKTEELRNARRHS